VKIVFINNRRGVRKTLRLQGWAKVAMSLCVLGLPLSAGLFLGIQLGGGKIGVLLENNLDNLQEELTSQRDQLLQSRKLADQQVQALSLKLAEMQAKLVRLDALGERLTTMADLDDGEFNFSDQVPIGGPESFHPSEVATPQVDLHLLFNELEAQISDRENQLTVLESLLVNRQLNEDISIAGKPVEKGWVSSRYGMRTDPFTGRKSWHKGVDFAGRRGANVVSVGSGVVTWSGPYQGYGNMVEIDHGEGFVTRYAHNQQNSVKVGELVQRGQVIAMMGSTGRSTGPHLHFEVYKNGRAVDPSTYIRKTLR
jgi:murein DD-endopeptidase MepM/ murein hydrolase activator NlpD